MILLKMFLLQAIVAVVVLVVLWFLLEKELVLLAIERLSAVDPGEDRDEREATVLAARKIPRDLEVRLRAAIKEKFPMAGVTIVISREIVGGVVIQVGKVLVDSSLMSKVRSIWGGAST